MVTEKEYSFPCYLNSDAKALPEDCSNLGFGELFSDHMFVMDYEDGKWNSPRIEAHKNFSLPPSTAVLHYGQGIFEGLKAYRSKKGIFLFRPEENIKRMNLSAKRMMMPEIDEKIVLEALQALCQIDAAWIPGEEGTAFYIRPTMIAMDNCLGVKPSKKYRFFIIAGPVGAYYKSGFSPVSIEVSECYVRAVPGGTGAAKTMGNYAASLLAAHEAGQRGHTQVLWLDAIDRKYIEEIGVMNVFIYKNGTLITPFLGGTILPGITRDSILQLAKKEGIPTQERKISMDELVEGIEDGSVSEMFGTGTAAVISIIDKISFQGKSYNIPQKEDSLAKKMFKKLTQMQYGLAEDSFGWVSQVQESQYLQS
jgi:branched-chain amino acid aminotransferase